VAWSDLRLRISASRLIEPSEPLSERLEAGRRDPIETQTPARAGRHKPGLDQDIEMLGGRLWNDRKALRDRAGRMLLAIGQQFENLSALRLRDRLENILQGSEDSDNKLLC
jgi:hypothetical protein